MIITGSHGQTEIKLNLSQFLCRWISLIITVIYNSAGVDGWTFRRLTTVRSTSRVRASYTPGMSLFGFDEANTSSGQLV